jgi:hypothetical protein
MGARSLGKEFRFSLAICCLMFTPTPPGAVAVAQHLNQQVANKVPFYGS